jgi:predicted ATPase
VWLVDLASVTDPRLVPQQVGNSLMVRESAGELLTQTLVETLQRRQLLLVLDNCEHLAQACAELADALLRACPDLRILATSRESLGVAGEALWPVPPVELPDRRGLAAPQEVEETDAIQLFVERAQAVTPDFVLTPESASTVAAICARLDGVPLAIELVAPRVRVMSLEEVLDRLRDPFQLLTGGARTGPPRHRTLQAAIDWSYELLEDSERCLLDRLSVFAGGWTVQAAEDVCAFPPITVEAELVDLLTSLVNRSWITVEQQSLHARQRLLQTMRQYAQWRLNARGETDVLRARHAAFFLRFAERADVESRGPNQRFWHEHLVSEHDNLRAALATALDQSHVEHGLRLAAALYPFWLEQGYVNEGDRWLSVFLGSAMVGEAQPAVRAHGMVGAGRIAVAAGDYVRAHALLTMSLELARAAGLDAIKADALSGLGQIARYRGDFPTALSYCEEALQTGRAADDLWGMASSLSELGALARHQGDQDRARAVIREDIGLWRKTGDKRRLAYALTSLGQVAMAEGQDEESIRLFEESLSLHTEAGSRTGISSCSLHLAEMVLRRGEIDRAGRLAQDALRAAFSTGDRRCIAFALANSGNVARASKD